MFTATALLDCGQGAVGIGMTAASTIAQLTHAVQGVRIFRFLVWPGFVVIGMAAGTIRTVSRCGPGGCLGVTLVAGRTQRVASMIPRVFT